MLGGASLTKIQSGPSRIPARVTYSNSPAVPAGYHCGPPVDCHFVGASETGWGTGRNRMEATGRRQVKGVEGGVRGKERAGGKSEGLRVSVGSSGQSISRHDNRAIRSSGFRIGLCRPKQ